MVTVVIARSVLGVAIAISSSAADVCEFSNRLITFSQGQVTFGCI